MLRELDGIDVRVVLDDAVLTRDEFAESEPFAEQLTLKELALGEDEFYRRRRLEKKRISAEADRRRQNDTQSSTSTSTSSANATANASGNGTTNANARANASAFATSSRMTVRSVTVSDCLANRCGTKVTIWSPQYVRWKVINRAFDVLRAKPGFNSVYNTDRANIVVRHVNGKRYAVLVPFSERYYEEF